MQIKKIKFFLKNYFLKVLTKDWALQYNWNNPIDTTGTAPVPPVVQTKLPPFAGLLLSLDQAMER